MSIKRHVSCARAVLVALTVAGTSACAQSGLGDILGGVLNPAPAQTISGTIQGVDTRAQQIFVRTSDNQTVGIRYDSRTEVVYQQQEYPVTALEAGDVVNMRILSTTDGHYTDLVTVTQSSTASGQTGQLYSLEGTVRQVDTVNGWFTMDMRNTGTVTVTLPYNPRSTDVTRLRSLRSGDFVRVRAYQLTSSRFELSSFY